MYYQRSNIKEIKYNIINDIMVKIKKLKNLRLFNFIKMIIE